MTMQTPQSASNVLGPERSIQQAEAMQLAQPLAVLHIGLAPRHTAHMTCVHQIHFDAGCFQLLVQGDPVDSMATVVTRHSFNQSTAASNPSVNALKQRTVGWPALTLSTGTAT